MKLFLAALLIFSNAYGQQCPHWVTTIYDHYADATAKITTNSPQVAPLRLSVQAIDSMVKRNAAYNSLHELRLRTHFWLSNGGMFGARINVNGYSKKGWDEKCGIIPQADRIAANDANLHFDINIPGKLSIPHESVYGYLQDIRAFAEPEQVGTIADGIPVYRTIVTSQQFALVTYNGKVPWLPLTVNEHLDAYATELRKKTAEFEAEKKRASYPQKTTEEYKKYQTARLARNDSLLKKEWADFEKYRASLSPQQLQQHAVVGNGGPYGLYKEGPNRKKYPMVKLAPEFVSNRENKNAIRMIMVSHSGENTWSEVVRKAYETLDYAMLKRLMH
jgi:hypothetical protein